MGPQTTRSWVHIVLLASVLMRTEFCYSIFIYFSTLALKPHSVFCFFLSTKAVQTGTVTNTCSSDCTDLIGSLSALGHFPFLCVLTYTRLTSSLLSNALLTIQPFYALGWCWASEVPENWGFLIPLSSLSPFTANLMQLERTELSCVSTSESLNTVCPSFTLTFLFILSATWITTLFLLQS